MDVIILLTILFISVLYWQSALKAKETALPFSRRTCKQMQYQFLDDTVALQRIRPIRSQNGWLTWHRTYSFEYCDEELNRRKGLIIYAENRVESIQLQDEDGRIITVA